MTKTYDLYDALTGDELDQVTNIFLEALARSKSIEPEVFEIVTTIHVDQWLIMINSNSFCGILN